MGLVIGVHSVVMETGSLRRALVDARHRDGHVEELQDGGALRLLVFARNAAEVVRRNTALLVGRARQRDIAFLLCHKVGDFHRVADSVDIGVRGEHVGVREDRAARVEREPGVLRKCRVRPHADGENDHVRLKFAVRELYAELAALFLDGRHAVVQNEIQALASRVLMHLACHIVVQRGDEMIAQLDNRCFHAGFLEVFGHLHADVAAADDDGTVREFLLDIFADLLRVGDVAQGEDALVVHAGQRRHDRGRAGRENQLVIALFILALGCVDRHGLFRRMDRRDLTVHAHVHVEAALEALGSL